MRRRACIGCSIAAGACLAFASLAADERAGSGFERHAEFNFARLAFSTGGHIGRGRQEPWLRDWPEAEEHFLQGLRRLTRIDAGRESGFVELGARDDALFDHPVIYGVKVGFWDLDVHEATRLREYLNRGGFLIVDDFHGPYEWEVFQTSMQRVFGNRPIVDIDDQSEIFHVLYDLDQSVQIPGVQAVWQGVTWEHPQGVPARWRGVYDDDGRLMVAINFNMDLGDAWEHADDAFYPEPLTALAYRFGVNYLLYAMTH
jgi:hypothetical protein